MSVEAWASKVWARAVLVSATDDGVNLELHWRTEAPHGLCPYCRRPLKVATATSCDACRTIIRTFQQAERAAKDDYERRIEAARREAQRQLEDRRCSTDIPEPDPIRITLKLSEIPQDVLAQLRADAAQRG